MCNGPYNRHYATTTTGQSASYSSSNGGMQNRYASFDFDSLKTYNQSGQIGDDSMKSPGMKNNTIGLKALNKEVLMWAGFFTASLFVYSLLSGGDFSFLLTYGGLARMFGFAILNLKIFGSGFRTAE